MQFLYFSGFPTLDFQCHRTDLSGERSQSATKRLEATMRAQTDVREQRPAVAGWMSRKSGYAVILLSALLGISLAVNTSIILLASSRL
jgi:hypothetical protein